MTVDQIWEAQRSLREHSVSEGPLAVVTWGSSTAPAREAIAIARDEGIDVKLIALRLLSPTRPEAFDFFQDSERFTIASRSGSSQYFVQPQERA